MPLSTGHKQFSRFLLVWVLLFVLKLGFSQSQPEDYTIETIPFEGELAGFKGSCMLQDSEGFMWFGSLNGLFRYDGSGFKVFRHEPGNENSISDDWIKCMVEDEEGILWIGSARDGLFKWMVGGDGSVYFKNYCQGKDIFKIMEDHTGRLWLSGYISQDLCYYNREEDQIR